MNTPKPPYADTLFRAIKSLDLPFGFEQSIKLEPGFLLNRRFTIALLRASLGKDPIAEIRRIVTPFGMPQNCLVGIARNVMDAKYIHFGYEANAKSKQQLKVYLEFPRQLGRLIARRNHVDGPLLLGLGFKWNPLVPENYAVSQYSCNPSVTIREMKERMVTICGSSNNASCIAAISALDAAIKRTKTDNLLFSQVTEENNPRNSFVLTLHRAEMEVGQAAINFDNVFDYFHLARKDKLLLTACTGQSLRHISGGIGRQGTEFFTIYYGTIMVGSPRQDD